MDYKHSDVLVPQDLRTISAGADESLTLIYVTPERHASEFLWVAAGKSALRRFNNSDEYALSCYMGRNATDFDHSVPIILQLRLMGVTFEGMNWHCPTFSAFVPPDSRRFDVAVPPVGYDPFGHPKTRPCKECQEPHPIVPHDCFLPETSPEVYQALLGKRVRIEVGAALPNLNLGL
tara:strand:- start:23225 stop:23755 length:531 start_codon:yes stop_codon:yes gene_type:complete